MTGSAGLRAVLFDMDGTLVETEELWGEAMSALAGRLGGTFSAEGREQTVGTSMQVAMTVLHADLGVRASSFRLSLRGAGGRFVDDAAMWARAEERGEVRPGMDRSVTAEAISALLVQRWLLTGEPLDTAYVDEVFETIVLPLLRNARPAAG